MIDFRDIEVKSGNQSFIITVAVGLISLLLLLISFSFEVNKTQQHPIEIAMNFGNTEMGQGEDEPKATETPSPSASNTQTDKQSTQTKNTSTSITPSRQALTEKTTENRPIASNQKTTPKKKQTSSTKQAESKPQGDQRANNALSSLLSGKGKSNSGQGNNGVAGNVGDPKGSNSHGTGIGENWKSTIPEPQQHSCSTSGTIVVEIIVNASGSIKSATPGAKGSTSTDACLKARAKELVLKYVRAYPGSDGRKGFYRVNLR